MPVARIRFGGSIGLSDLEMRCLRLYGAGWSRSEISDMARVSRRTVGATLTVAKEKLGARSLAHAALILGTGSAIVEAIGELSR
jgi:DNA-binding CsgD family transcriptional regulator